MIGIKILSTRKIHNLVSLFISLFFINLINGQVTTVISPTNGNGGFEQGASGWSIQSNSGNNKWVVGSTATAGYSGSSCAFISNSTVIPYQHQYTTTSASISKLYRDVYFPANTSNFVLKFKTLTQGTYNATLQVFLLPSDQVLDPNADNNFGETALFTLSSQGTSWIDKKIDLSPTLLGNASVGVTKKLVFVWHNYANSSGTQPPAAIDDIAIENCSVPNNITALSSYNQLTLDWSSPDTSWNIRYKMASSSNWTTLNTTTKPYVLTNLPPSTLYNIQIQNALLPCSDWSTQYTYTTIPLSVDCANATLIEAQDDVDSVVMVLANFTGATLSGPIPVCNYTFPSNSGNLWFRFTANATKYILDANPYSIKAELYMGTDCNNLIYQYCKNGASYLDNLIPGNQYYLKLIDTNIQNSPFTSDQLNFRLVKCPNPPVNDLCENAILNTGTMIQGQLVGANIEYPGLANDVLGDIWYSFVATENYASIAASAPGPISEYRSVYVNLYTGNCSSLTLFQTLGEFSSSMGNAKNTGLLQIGQTYYVRVFNPNVTKSWPVNFNATPKASPVNDLCSSPTNITLEADGETQFSTPNPTYATASTGVPSTCSITSTKDIWYQFIAGTTTYQISSNSLSNTYSGSCGNFTQVGCGTTYTITNLTVGQVYFIRVYNSQTIIIREFAAADECDNSSVLIPAVNPAFTYSSTLNATAGTLPTTCIANNKDVWFQFTATSTKNKITLYNGYATSVNEALAITVYSGTCSALTQMGCTSLLNNGNMDIVLSSYVVGQTYYIKATRANSTYFGIKVIPMPTQPNDEVATAITITPNEPGVCTLIDASTAGATPSTNIPANCVGSTASINDVWYSFVATVPTYKFIFNTAGNHNFNIYKADASNILTSFTCTAGSLSGFEVGATYYIRVTAYSETDSQIFNLCLSKIIDTPANDECINAISIPVAPTMICSESITGNFTNATYNVISPSNNCYTDNDVWYQFTATSTKLLFNNTGTIMKRIRYSLLQGNCSALTCISSGEVYGTFSDVLRSLTVGTTYFIKLSYYNYDNDFSFCLSTAPVIENDACENATVLIPASNLTCNPVRTYSCAEPSTSLTVSGCTATIPLYIYNAASNSNYTDIWFKFTATNTEHVLTGAGGSGNVQLFEGNCNGFTCHASFNYLNTNNVTDYLFTQLTIGQTYYIRVLRRMSAANLSYYDICLKTPTSFPSNDEYSNAMVLIPSTDLDTCNSVSNVFNRATASSNLDTPSCSSANNPKDVWFQFTATAPNHQLQIHVSNPEAKILSFFTSLYSSVNGVINQEVSCYDPFENVVPNLDVPLSGLSYNSAGYYMLVSQNYYNLTVGATYYIRMYPYVDQPSYEYQLLMSYDVCLKTLPDIPANSDYTTAQPLTVSLYDNIQYVTGYSTRAAYHVTEPFNTVTNPCGELGAFAYPSNQANNVWYKFTAQQTSEALHVINDANVVSPLISYYNLQYYPLYAALYEYNNDVMETKQCYADAASNIVFNNLEIGKEYYLKMMYRNVLYESDFEFQVSVANTTLLGLTSSEQKNITLYPNPVENVMTIANPNQQQLTGIKLYNMLGQLVLEQKTETNSDLQIDLSQLQKGAYVLKLKSSEGENSYSFLKK